MNPPSPDGATIVAGVPGGGTFYNPITKQIVIDPAETDTSYLEGALAHENMHHRQQIEGRNNIGPMKPGETLQEYEKRYVDFNLALEAEAAFAQAQVNPLGMFQAQKDVYQSFVSGQLTISQALNLMADVIRDLQPSNSNYLNYDSYYRAAFREAVREYTDYLNMQAILASNIADPPPPGPTDVEIQQNIAALGDFPG